MFKLKGFVFCSLDDCDVWTFQLVHFLFLQAHLTFWSIQFRTVKCHKNGLRHNLASLLMPKRCLSELSLHLFTEWKPM